MIYRLPAISDRIILEEYLQELRENGESILSIRSGLSETEYAEWVERIRRNAADGDAEWGRSRLELCFDGDRLIGLVSIRYELPEPLSAVIGDIGAGVRPSERNRGYGTKMLGHALSVCREKGMTKVILGCFRDNPASAAMIRKNGGVLFAENENYQEGKTCQYYRVDL